jgi:ribosomal protein S18 acetylase RimI-like enzyme
MYDPPTSKPEPLVRSANLNDTAAVASCVNAAFSVYIARIGIPPAPMLADFPKIIAAGQVWVAEVATKVVGVLVQYETESGFYIDTVAVLPALQGTGIGRALLLFAETEATRRGFRSIYLCTNSKMTENQVFYPRIGYVEYERKRDQGYDRIFYRKQLP